MDLNEFSKRHRHFPEEAMFGIGRRLKRHARNFRHVDHSIDTEVIAVKELELSPAQKHEIQKGRDGLARILAASDAEIHDRRFLLDCVCQIGIAYQDWQALSPFTRFINSTSYGIVQIPTELVDYLMIAGKFRPETVAEVGVFHGGTAYISAAYFYRLNKNLRYTLIDICDSLFDYDYLSSVLPLDLQIPKTSGDFIGRHFDLAFIDADHGYDGSRIDWLNVGRHAGVAAFHDIDGAEYDGLNGGIRRTWNELKLEYRMDRPIIEVSHHPSWMGIGMIFNDRAVSTGF
ncbi:hypothetical protein M2322_003319 [Rhodoblastus acidophilus]|uniref:class I SAM-dependent methyltransferase n=1 Tax=Rhodoblastus acidophilus TaxID=1074 RepID=UPI002225013A|nr:class I SAM-dependent methyltransferase [Rhodoblastus acidophilus]MCW2317755.1 hypothetical protein [Rhodoblastus acidophilus]